MLLPDQKLIAWDKWDDDMSDPFRHVDLHLQYAEEMISDLERDITAFLNPETCMLHATYKEDMNIYFLNISEYPSRTIPVRIGSAIGVIREALDHIICAMAARNGEAVGKQQFPFKKTESEFQKAGTRSAMCTGLTDDQWNLVAGISPFPGGDLYNLHELSNKKKHRDLLTSMVGVVGANVSRRIRVRAIDPYHVPQFGASNLFMIIEGPQIENLSVTLGLKLREEGIPPQETVIDTLRRYHGKVAAFLHEAKVLNMTIPRLPFVYVPPSP